MSDANDLSAFLNEAWQHLSHGVADSRSPARYPTFATVSPDGVPEARTVALRSAEQRMASVSVHTDIATSKISALQNNPLAALHIWLPRAELQLRLTARVEILTGETVEPEWIKIPDSSRVSYGTNPRPGTPIDHVFDYDKPANRARFAVLKCQLQEIDLVHLGPQHRRARFRNTDNWRGAWLAP